MTLRIENLVRRPVSIRGNSGQTWHLPPGAAVELADVEVEKNAKIERLAAQRLISIAPEAEAPSTAEPEPKRRGRGSKK